MTAFDPIQKSRAPRAQHRQVLSKQRQAERKHPDAEDWEEGKYPSDDQQQASWNAQPAPGRPPQEAHRHTQPSWQAVDEFLQTPIVTGRSAGRQLPRTA